jgi:hypothetical protein
MPPRYVQRTYLQFTYRRPRCIVHTFNYSHAAGLGALYGSLIQMSPAPIGASYGHLITYCRPWYKHAWYLQYTFRLPRCVVRPFNYSHAGLAAAYGPLIIHIPPFLVHCTDL